MRVIMYDEHTDDEAQNVQTQGVDGANLEHIKGPSSFKALWRTCIEGTSSIERGKAKNIPKER